MNVSSRSLVRLLLVIALACLGFVSPAAAQAPGDKDSLSGFLTENFQLGDVETRIGRILGGAGGGTLGFLTASTLAGVGLTAGLPITIALVGGGILIGAIAGPAILDALLHGSKGKKPGETQGARTISQQSQAASTRRGMSLLGVGTN